MLTKRQTAVFIALKKGLCYNRNMKLGEMIDKWRETRKDVGYSCDACGREVFSYPENRLCPKCDKTIERVGEKRCPVCGRKIVSQGVCLACKNDRPTFAFAVAALSYENEAAALVNRFKNGERYLSALLAKEMARAFAPYQDEEYILAFVPISDQSRESRGYDQAELLCKDFARESGLVFSPDILVRASDKETQKNFSARERKENIHGAFRVHARKAVEGKAVLVIDDVMTTGATLSECARILYAAGARKVSGLVATAVPEQKP